MITTNPNQHDDDEVARKIVAFFMPFILPFVALLHLSQPDIFVEAQQDPDGPLAKKVTLLVGICGGFLFGVLLAAVLGWWP